MTKLEIACVVCGLIGILSFQPTKIYMDKSFSSILMFVREIIMNTNVVYDKTIFIPNTVELYSNLFINAGRNFRPSVVFEDGINIGSREPFYGCNGFNGSITIPYSFFLNNVSDRSNSFNIFFNNCTNFNGEIKFSNECFNKFIDVSYLFRNNTIFGKYNRAILLPRTVTNSFGMFSGANSFGSDIYMDNILAEPNWYGTNNYFYRTPIDGIFYGANTSLRKNLWIYRSLSRFISNVFGSSSMEMVEMEDGNGYYYPNANCYIYNNYIPTWMRS